MKYIALQYCLVGIICYLYITFSRTTFSTGWWSAACGRPVSCWRKAAVDGSASAKSLHLWHLSTVSSTQKCTYMRRPPKNMKKPSKQTNNKDLRRRTTNHNKPKIILTCNIQWYFSKTSLLSNKKFYLRLRLCTRTRRALRIHLTWIGHISLENTCFFLVFVLLLWIVFILLKLSGAYLHIII